jgi:hypothetical protein
MSLVLAGFSPWITLIELDHEVLDLVRCPNGDTGQVQEGTGLPAGERRQRDNVEVVYLLG